MGFDDTLLASFITFSGKNVGILFESIIASAHTCALVAFPYIFKTLALG